jgi:hypothetical protein
MMFGDCDFWLSDVQAYLGLLWQVRVVLFKWESVLCFNIGKLCME